MSDNIVALKARLERLKNDELNIIQLIEIISVNDEDAVRGCDLFLETNRNNPDVLLRTKEIYVNIVDQMMPFLESFEDINNERGDEKVGPTNVPCERVFGVLKYAEKALPNLQFGLLAQHAMTKFNKVSVLLPSIVTAKLEEFHSEIFNIEKEMKKDHIYQQ